MRSLRVFGALLWIVASSVVSAQEAGRTPGLSPYPLRIPLHFIENRGIYPEAVRYYVQGKEKTVFFTEEGITFALRGKQRDWVVKVDFVGRNPEVKLRGADRRAAVFSYFRGPEEAWKTGLRSYGQVVYEELWPGIDLMYRAEVNAIKYEFRVKPGADPGRIRLRYRGVSSLKRTSGGALRIETSVGAFEDAPPVAFQQNQGGGRSTVNVAYTIESTAGEAVVGFRVGNHAEDRPLVIDPAVYVYCGYLGGTGDDGLYGIDVDSQGNAYVGGITCCGTPTFPVKVGPSTKYNGRREGIVAKVDASGTKLIYCGYIGGTSDEFLYDIAVDSHGCAYVFGHTGSKEDSFPVKGGPDLTFNGARGLDCFVAKVSADGSSLVYCGYIGGERDDYGRGIAVDKSGCAYVVGATGSRDPMTITHGTPFPTSVGPDLTFNDPWAFTPDGFIAKVDASGKKLVYCGYIGGALNEAALDVAVDALGNAYVVGWTVSTPTSFPVKVGPSLKHASPGRYGDGFVARVNAAGTGLDYCGYIGGSDRDGLGGVAVDATGHAYVAGYSISPANTLPLVVGPNLNLAGCSLVAKVSPSGSSLVWCGLVGGISSAGIDVDARGHAYVCGQTNTPTSAFPVKEGPQLTYGGNGDGFMAKIDSSGRFLHYSGFVGGAMADEAWGIAVTPSGNAFVAGKTFSDEKTFPVKLGPDLTYGGGLSGSGDGFVAKVKFTQLAASGTPRIGGTATFTLMASDSAGLPYQAGSSLGTGPITIDTRRLGLSPDGLLQVSVHDFWPQVFVDYRGTIGPDGEARAKIVIPPFPQLVGLRIYSAFVTLHPPSPSGIRDISNTVLITLVK